MFVCMCVCMYVCTLIYIYIYIYIYKYAYQVIESRARSEVEGASNTNSSSSTHRKLADNKEKRVKSTGRGGWKDMEKKLLAAGGESLKKGRKNGQ